MSKMKVRILTKADEIRPVKPEHLEVLHCPSCTGRVILEIKEPKEKPVKKKEEPKKEEVTNSTGKQSMDIPKEEEKFIKKQKEETKELDLTQRPYSINPEVIKHYHIIKFGLGAMIFSFISMVILIIILKFI